MTDITVTVHRSTHEIGGNCIELATSDGHRLLLDAGRPLDAPEGVRTGLLPPTLNVEKPVDAVLLSHPHQDHYGVLNELPATWPVFSGKACEKLVRLTASMFGSPPSQTFHSWTSGSSFVVGPFTVTPFLTDHSAFDAYMLLVEVAGRRVLYSGDFRLHGRKAKLVRAMMARPPSSIDLLVMEGTNLGTDKPCITEGMLENRFVELFERTAGRVFVAWSAQNVDRTVTLYRACLKTGRTLVVDLYTAEVMEMLADFGRLPTPGWRNLKVVVTNGFGKMYKSTGREAFVDRMVKHGIGAGKIAEDVSKWVAMVRPSLVRDYEHKGVTPGPDDAWCWSMWRGYLDNERGKELRDWFEAPACPATHIHSSGHASPTDLRRLAERINPRWLVPVHGTAWDSDADGFPPVKRLADGEPLLV